MFVNFRIGDSQKDVGRGMQPHMLNSLITDIKCESSIASHGIIKPRVKEGMYKSTEE